MADRRYAGVAVLALGLFGWLGVAQTPALVTPGAVDTSPSAVQQANQLRVCADPNNLPFSNRKEQGFHNRLAEMFAEELDLAGVSYTWWPQRRGFIRNTLKKKKCDVVFGVPAGYDILQPTKPFYRSPYVFLYRSDADFEVSSLDDPILRELKIGVNLIGDDYFNPPPAHALGARGIVGNVQGFTVYGDYDEDSPPKAIVEAVARGDVELAIVWGPVAGYWSQKQDAQMTIHALPAVDDSTGFPMAYNMALGIRRGEDEWRARLEKVIAENHEEIYRILGEEYNVPLLPVDTTAATGNTGEDDDGAGAGAAASATVGGQTYGVGGGPLASSDPDRPASTPGPRAAAPAVDVPPSALLHRAPAAARDTPAVTETVYKGWRQFMVHCVRCHGEAATGTTIAPSLLDAVNRQAFGQDSFTTVVMQGRVEKGMPAWNELLDMERANAIYEYILARTEGLPAGRPEAPPADSDSSAEEDSDSSAEGDSDSCAEGDSDSCAEGDSDSCAEEEG